MEFIKKWNFKKFNLFLIKLTNLLNLNFFKIYA